jgi:putative tryptophan/tyrosine transport system substrate-binding protein
VTNLPKSMVLITCLLSGLLAPLLVQAQSAAKVARVGYLALDLGADDSRRNRDAFVEALRGLGYIEGRNLLIDYRDAKGKPERFPSLAAELLVLKPDVIVTAGGTLAALAAKRATPTVPIVFAGVGDPVRDGLVKSLARPGTNVTGNSLVLQLVGKLLELLQQAAPEVRNVALLMKRDAAPDETIKTYIDAAHTGARALGLRVEVVWANGPEEFERAFAQIRSARLGAVAVVSTPVFTAARRNLVELAAKNQLPTIFSLADFVEAGGLMSYGPDLRDVFRRTAVYVDKILKGARASDLPVEQPTKFELVINLKTAKALGRTIPPALLARADRIIEK